MIFGGRSINHPRAAARHFPSSSEEGSLHVQFEYHSGISNQGVRTELCQKLNPS
jgi:hypothetical protein